MEFKELGINEQIVKKLSLLGIHVATPVQEECIPEIKDGKDIIVESQTGTGKTLAFLLPMFENMSDKNNNIQGLIITPTRELAIQITEEANKINEVKNINILCAYGGKDIGSQLNKLKGNIHLVIATPGRLLDHIKRKTINLGNLNTLVLDEADQMLLMGFKNEVSEIIKHVNRKRQTLCFSATINSEVKKLAYRYTNNPVEVSIKKEKVTLENIKQFVVETTDRKKLDDLCTVLDEDRPFMAIIFCRTKRRVDKLEEDLSIRGYDCEKLHGDMTQSKREKVIKDFRNIKVQYLIATDVAGRGLDVNGVTHIYNYDIPENAESYIHRIGRTGRAGEQGYTCLFVDPKDKNILEEIEKNIQLKIPKRNI